MKRVEILLMIMSALFVVSCSSSAERVENVADEFLTAHFQMDYERAYTLCTEEIATAIKEQVESVTMPEDTLLLAKIKEASENTQFEVVGVNLKSKDTAYVSYTITPFASESKIESRMILIKRDKDWRVYSLQ